MSVHRVLTVHAEVGMEVRLALLDALEGALNDQGAIRIWIDSGSRPDLVVLAEFDNETAGGRRPT